MNHIKRLLCLSLVLFALVPAMQAEDFSAKEVVLEHIKDSHDWHVTDLGRTAPGSLRTGHRHRG